MSVSTSSEYRLSICKAPRLSEQTTGVLGAELGVVWDSRAAAADTKVGRACVLRGGTCRLNPLLGKARRALAGFPANNDAGVQVDPCDRISDSHVKANFDGFVSMAATSSTRGKDL